MDVTLYNLNIGVKSSSAQHNTKAIRTSKLLVKLNSQAKKSF